MLIRIEVLFYFKELIGIIARTWFPLDEETASSRHVIRGIYDTDQARLRNFKLLINLVN